MEALYSDARERGTPLAFNSHDLANVVELTHKRLPRFRRDGGPSCSSYNALPIAP
nr:hypothetical protein Q903MT_gene1352 [Picea sitchensis]